jgi:hypothetical protein
MAMTFENLDPVVRLLMVEEMNLDISLKKLYQGKRLTSFGLQDWPAALKVALEVGNDVSLTAWLSQPGRLEHSKITPSKALANRVVCRCSCSDFR